MGVFEEDELAKLGVTINSHGKMPDLVVHLPVSQLAGAHRGGIIPTVPWTRSGMGS